MIFLSAALMFAPALPQSQAVRDDAAMRSVMLSTHNRARREVGVAPVRWSDALAADARVHALWMARTGQFEHSKGRVNQGENLWMGTRGAYSYAEMSGSWIAEKRYYKDAPSPDNSTTGRWADVGHYTQIVWSTTTEIGCALASSATADYLVCRYSPPGNYRGRKAFEPRP